MSQVSTIEEMIEHAATCNGYIMRASSGMKNLYLNEETGDMVEILSPAFLNQKTAAMCIQQFYKNAAQHQAQGPEAHADQDQCPHSPLP